MVFLRPPWYLSRPGSGPIGFQEDVFLSGLQAMSKGATPYIGPASVQYGPGVQLLSYLFMRHAGAFSVVGFRESWDTLLAAPGLVIMVATALPRLLGASRPAMLAAGVAIFAASFALLPPNAVRPASVRSWATAPLRDRQRLAAEPASVAPLTIAGRRVGAGLATAPQCCQASSVPMPQFTAFMNHLHAIIGNRVTYVVSFPAGYPGIVYFVADLTPAPVPVDLHTMVLTIPQYRAYLADFQTSVLPKTAALVTPSLGAVEAQYFRHFYPDADVITLSYSHEPVYVLLRRG